MFYAAYSDSLHVGSALLLNLAYNLLNNLLIPEHFPDYLPAAIESFKRK